MSGRCKDWRHAALAAGLLVLVLASFLRWTLYPAYAAWVTQQDEIDFLIQRIERFRSHVGEQEILARQLETLSARSQASGFLATRASSIAAADLQRALAAMVEAYGAQLISTQPVESPPEDGLIRVGLRVNLRGTLDAVVPILHQLEAQRPYLFLDAVHLQGRTSVGVQRRQPDLLQARFEMFGYMRATQ